MLAHPYAHGTQQSIMSALHSDKVNAPCIDLRDVLHRLIGACGIKTFR